MHHQAKFIATLACLGALPCVADYSDTIIAADPLAYYRLGEASGTTAVNSATGGNSIGVDGTYVGTFGLGATSLVPTETDTASTFSVANNSHVNIDNGAYEGTIDARSTELWFKADDVSRGGGSPEKQVIWEEGGATRGLNIYVFNGQLYFHAWNANDGDADTWGANNPTSAAQNGDGTARAISTAINIGQTYHAVIVYDDVGNATGDALDGTLTAYVNGVSIGGFNDVGRIFTHSDTAAIGRVSGTTLFHDDTVNGSTGSPGNEYFDGVIDDVSIYNYALTSTQVLNHYNEGVPEPSSLALLSLGGLLLARRRRG